MGLKDVEARLSILRFLVRIAGALAVPAMALLIITALHLGDPPKVAGATNTPSMAAKTPQDPEAPAAAALFMHQYPDPIFAMLGGDAPISVVVENRGDVALTTIIVTADMAPECARTISNLAAGSGVTYTCYARHVTQDFDNKMTARASTTVGDSDISTIHVVWPVSGPAIGISQDPARTMVVYGTNAKFYMAVLNPGNIAMTNVSVNNTVVPDCNKFYPSIGPGQIEYYICYALTPAASFNSTVMVSGIPQGGGAIVTDTDADPIVMADYYIAPSFNVNTTTVRPGKLLTYTLTIENIEPAAPLPPVTATNVAMYIALPPGTTLAKVISGTYSSNLSSFLNAPSGPGIYWQGDLPRRQPRTMKLVVMVTAVGGNVSGIGRATNHGEVFLDETTMTAIVPNHRVFAPTAVR